MSKKVIKINGPYLRHKSLSNITNTRRIIILTYEDGTKSTKSYARHLMEEKLGRSLTKEETVDHIDGNSLNDSENNLRILSRRDNILEHLNQVPSNRRKWYLFNCPVCQKETKKKYNEVKWNWKKGSDGPFCSKICSGIFNNGGWDEVKNREKIKEIQGRMSKSENETVLKTVGIITYLEGSNPSTPTI